MASIEIVTGQPAVDARRRLVGASVSAFSLAPGAGTKLTLRFKRHANQPTLGCSVE